MKRSEIKKRLSKIVTGFPDKNKKTMSIDNFGSFLITKDEFPSNEKIKNIVLDRKVVPNDIKKIFPTTSFAFPNDSFFNDEEFNNDFMFIGLNMAARNRTDYSNWGNFRDTSRPTNTYRLYVQNNDKKFRGSYITDIIKDSVDSDSGNVMRNFFIRNNLSYLKEQKSESKSNDKRIKKMRDWQDKYLKQECEKVEKKNQKLSENEKIELPKLEFSAEEMVKKNEKIMMHSMDCFILECMAVQPKHLIIFGKDADIVLSKMSNSYLFNQRVHELSGKIPTNSDFHILDLIENHSTQITHYASRRCYLKNGTKRKGYTFQEWLENAPKELSDIK